MSARPWLPLFIGLVASVFAHLILIAPMLAWAMSASIEHRSLEAALDPEDFEDAQRQPPPPEDDEVRLGIDALAPSSFTWIGYDEYQQHLAALAEVEQAAFAEQGSPALRAGSTTTSEKPDTTETAASEESQAPAETSQAPAAAPDLLALHHWLESIPLSQERETDKREAPAVQRRVPQEQAVTQREIDSMLRELIAAAATQQALRQADSSPEIGAQSDKQSAPTSLLDVPRDQWQLGKPLAGPGLELKPRRPEMPLLTLLTAYPDNPICELHIDRAGVPVFVKLVKTTGDRRVDDALIASLYRWRASGEKLDALKDDETLLVNLQLLLTRTGGKR